MIEETREFLGEKTVGGDRWRRSRMHRFAHFWMLVAKSFVRNRCPLRAAALAYTTLLAIIPILAVALGIATSLLKKQGEEEILRLVDKLVAGFTPPGTITTTVTEPGPIVISPEPAPESQPPATNETTNVAALPPASAATNAAATNTLSATNAPAPIASGPVLVQRQVDMRRQAARTILKFVQGTNSGTLGVTGSVLLVFVVINMLGRVEETFNDIWGLSRGRSWGSRFVLYSALTFWGPILLVSALALAGGWRLDVTTKFIRSMPLVGSFFFQFFSLSVLCLTFALVYMYMPNTKVQWSAAVVGGVTGGVLWHLNNVFSVLYVSRWVANSRIYGGLAIIPVGMIGLYFGWLILLFGAQVAYAYQNRAAYLQEKQIESINQRGREFIALRLMAFLGQRFLFGKPPPSVLEMSAQLGVPSRLAQQLLQVLLTAQLVVEVSGPEIAYVPARPIETITCHDILLALRAGQGQELVTHDEPARTEVYGEFKQIMDAERRAASAVTVLMMVQRVQALEAGVEGQKTVSDSSSGQT